MLKKFKDEIEDLRKQLEDGMILDNIFVWRWGSETTKMLFYTPVGLNFYGEGHEFLINKIWGDILFVDVSGIYLMIC